MSAAIAGVGGALYAGVPRLGHARPVRLLREPVRCCCWLVVGGIGSAGGALFGGLVALRHPGHVGIVTWFAEHGNGAARAHRHRPRQEPERRRARLVERFVPLRKRVRRSSSASCRGHRRSRSVTGGSAARQLAVLAPFAGRRCGRDRAGDRRSRSPDGVGAEALEWVGSTRRFHRRRRPPHGSARAGPSKRSTLDGARLDARPLLEVREVTVRFGGNVALTRSTSTAEPGAGDRASSARTAPARRRCSTSSAGCSAPNAGTVSLDGRDVTGLKPHKRAPARARAHVPAARAVHARSTSREQHPGRGGDRARHRGDERRPRPRSPRRSSIASACTTSPTHRVDAAARPARPASSSSAARSRHEPRGAAARRARVRSGRGGDGRVREAAPRRSRQDGLAVLLVEHDVRARHAGVPTTCYVLDFGEVLAVGTAGRDPAQRGRASRRTSG